MTIRTKSDEEDELKVRTHAITGFGGGLVLARLLGLIEGIFFFLATAGMDFDHYLNFIQHSWHRRSRNLIKYFKYVVKTAPAFDEAHLEVLPNRKDALTFFVFHSAEFLLSLLLLGIFIKSDFLHSIFMGAFWGVAFHVVLDIVYNIRHKIFRSKAWSVVEYLIRRNLMKRRGIDPNKVFQEILNSLEKSNA